jgi:hypothetical protein
MADPKHRTSKRVSYWNSLTADELLAVELMTDSPETLEGLVVTLPQGDEEPHVEFAYNFLRTDHEKLRCIHCNQPHLAGYVMKVGISRFLVGHICGAHIYGENFKQYTNDYDEAATRQNTLQRVRDARLIIDPFLRWLNELSQADTFKLYNKIRGQFDAHMSWLVKKLEWHTNRGGGVLNGVNLPETFFDGFTDPQEIFRPLVLNITKAAMLLVGKIEIEKDARITLGNLLSMLTTLEKVLNQLSEPIEFFQPSVLGPICEWATENDNSKKRKYEAGLMSLAIRRETGVTKVKMPAEYRVPSPEPIQKLRAALAGFNSV